MDAHRLWFLLAPAVSIGLALILAIGGFRPALLLPIVSWTALRRAWRAFRRPGRLGWIGHLEAARLSVALGLTIVLAILLASAHESHAFVVYALAAASLAWSVAVWTAPRRRPVLVVVRS